MVCREDGGTIKKRGTQEHSPSCASRAFPVSLLSPQMGTAKATMGICGNLPEQSQTQLWGLAPAINQGLSWRGAGQAVGWGSPGG